MVHHYIKKSKKAPKKEINTFADYMADETRVTDAEREQINFQVALIGKMIKARETPLDYTLSVTPIEKRM